MILSQNKSDGPALTVPAEAAPMVAVPARLVRQTMVVPRSAAAIGGTEVKTAEPPAKGTFVVVDKHLFRNRWYVVTPDRHYQDFNGISR